MKIRRATAHDAATFTEFAARTFEETFASDNDPADLALYLAETYSEPRQRRELEDASLLTYLAEEDGVLVAFAQLRRAPVDGDENAVEIVRFYVARAWHGRGVAQRLMAHAKDVARERGASRIWLGVWERNARAIAFYKKCGFSDAGSQPFLLGRDLQTDRVMVARVLQ